MTEETYWYRYSSVYNMRPNECHGMGKENLIIFAGKPDTLKNIIDLLRSNSNLKHEDNKYWFYGTEEYVELEEWKPYVGQPMYFLVDIDYLPYGGEEKNPFILLNDEKKRKINE